jgi:glycosyltransferase involved in cell wall biosynthesis
VAGQGVLGVTDAGPDRPMRVLVLGHGAERTGPPVYLLRVGRWLVDHGNVQLEVVLLDDGPLLHELRELGPVTVLPEFGLTGRVRYLPALGQRLGGDRLAQRGREVALRGAANQVGEPDVVWINTAGSVRALRYLPFRPRRVVTHVHEMSLGLERYLRAEDRALIEERTGRYLTVSSPVTRHLVERWGIDPGRIGHAAGVVELPPPAARRGVGEVRSTVGARPGDLVVGTAGTVDWRKAPDLFLAAAAELRALLPGRRVVHVWIGGGELSPAWEAAHEMAAAAGLGDAVCFVGEQADALDWMRAFDLFVLPSREDAFPLVCLEAASVGVPVVCFDTGGIADFVAPSGEPPAGAVVPYPDVVAFARACARLLDDDAERAAAGELAARRVAERHAVEVGARHLLDELEAVARA